MAQMELIDTHAHLYATQFDSDRDKMLEQAFRVGVTQILLPNIDMDSIESMLKLTAQYPDRCFPMIGLHPCSVSRDYEAVLAKMKQELEAGKGKYIGIGETGLDYYWDTTYIAEQKEALNIQISLALQYNLPIILHARNSLDDLIGIITDRHKSGLRGIFHCFSGTMAQMERIVALKNFYFGIGGVVTFKNSGLDEIVKSIPAERILLETDAPYLAPTPFRGKRNECAYLVNIARKIAEIKGTTLDEVARQTSHNARNLFALPLKMTKH